MKKILIYLSLIFFFLFINIFYGETVTDSDSVRFLENEPDIQKDSLDKSIRELPERKFSFTESTNESLKPVSASYRLAYGMEFLYILIEVGSDSVIYRDRAYQNGDGFIVTIAKPQPNNEPTDEFYVLGFSPPNPGKNIAAQKFIWYRNIDLSFRGLKDSKINIFKNDNKVYYEAIIYWRELYPYHPLLSETFSPLGIGFNLCFVKAYNKNDKSYHFVVNDEYIQSELQKRNYEVLTFKSIVRHCFQEYCLLSRNNLTYKDELCLNMISKDKEDSNVYIEIRTYDSSLYFSGDVTMSKTNGIGYFTRSFCLISINNLSPQNYVLYWKSGERSDGKMDFTLLPEFNHEKYLNEINVVKDKVSEGSYNTMHFMLEDIYSRFKLLKPYESCPGILKDLSSFISYSELSKNNIDAIKLKTGIFRRGFYSSIDSTYRPYTIRIPDSMDVNKKYPLLVYLHGSGDDDRVAFQMNPVSDGNFIELYPNGRGTSNVYATPESQKDIDEAVYDVIKNYNIDTGNIILSGFSMGGYGVYRTYYEHSSLFKALAVFSGHPDLANQWLGEGHPNFLDEKYLGVFKGAKIFIFHGKQDMNCPYEKTVELVKKLKDAGAEVDFITEDTGHSTLSGASRQKFLEWLGKIVE